MSDAYKEIRSVIDVQSGFAFPSTSFIDDGVPIVRMSDLKSGQLDFKNAKHVSDLWLKLCPEFALNEGDFLLGMSGSLSNHAFVSVKDMPVLLNQRVARIKKKGSDGDYRYICFWLRSEFYTRYADIQGEGAAQKNISGNQIAAFKVRLPRLKEQERIAEILQALDEVIKKTESLIAKYQKIKAGLMHDLFTHGVTADGKLRPPREQAPELYQETPIGWIPVGWDCEELQNLLAPVANNLRSGPFGSALLKSELVEEGIPFLGIDNIFSERFEGNFRRFIPERKYLELNRYAVRPNDVVITIMGTVGRCCVLPENIGLALSSKHLWTMTFDEKKVFPELVCWQLNYAPWVLAWFRRESQGAVMDAIQSSTLRTLRLPVPDINEQKLILKRYLTCHSKITSEQNKLEKLKKQKAGLMQDLLTGKVPVKIDESDQEFA